MNYRNLITLTICACLYSVSIVISVYFCIMLLLHLYVNLNDLSIMREIIANEKNIPMGKQQQQILSIMQSRYHSNCQNNHQLSKYRTIYYCCNNDDNTQLLI